MQKWEYLFVEIVAEAGGTFHYRLNGVDQQTDTLEWKNGKFFNDLGQQGWDLIGALLRDAEKWSPSGTYIFKRPNEK
jgi:hypothetical protein